MDVRRKLAASPEGVELLRGDYPRFLCVSYHTTAGYLDSSLLARFGTDAERLESFLDALRTVFPPEAGYAHDRLDLRVELTEEQRAREPLNADSHLAFIGAGFSSCVSYRNRPGHPVWFVDLDGTYRDRHDREVRRLRRTTVVGYREEEVVANLPLSVPVNGSDVESVDLGGTGVDLLSPIEEIIESHGIGTGRVDLALEPHERNAGLTVNEYEPLLMRRDLVRMLQDPLRFMTEGGKQILRSPGQVAGRAVSHLRHDASHVLQELFRALGMEKSLVERAIRRALGLPPARLLRVNRRVSLPVLNGDGDRPGRIVRGTYQSPILIQWARGLGHARRVRARVVRIR